MLFVPFEHLSHTRHWSAHCRVLPRQLHKHCTRTILPVAYFLQQLNEHTTTMSSRSTPSSFPPLSTLPPLLNRVFNTTTTPSSGFLSTSPPDLHLTPTAGAKWPYPFPLPHAATSFTIFTLISFLYLFTALYNDRYHNNHYTPPLHDWGFAVVPKRMGLGVVTDVVACLGAFGVAGRLLWGGDYNAFSCEFEELTGEGTARARKERGTTGERTTGVQTTREQPRYATLRYATLRHATLRYATLRYATLRYATLRYDQLRCERLDTSDALPRPPPLLLPPSHSPSLPRGGRRPRLRQTPVLNPPPVHHPPRLAPLQHAP